MLVVSNTWYKIATPSAGCFTVDAPRIPNYMAQNSHNQCWLFQCWCSTNSQLHGTKLPHLVLVVSVMMLHELPITWYKIVTPSAGCFSDDAPRIPNYKSINIKKTRNNSRYDYRQVCISLYSLPVPWSHIGAIVLFIGSITLESQHPPIIWTPIYVASDRGLISEALSPNEHWEQRK